MSGMNFVPISKGFTTLGKELFKAGGFALAFGFSGQLLIVFSALRTTLNWPVFVFGCVLTVVCLGYFVFKGITERQMARRFKDDLPLLDSLQSTALKVSKLASLTQSIAFKHLGQIQAVAEGLGRILERIPFGAALIQSLGLADAAKISRTIVEAAKGVEHVVTDIEDALRNADLRKMNAYSAKLDEALARLESVLASESAT